MGGSYAGTLGPIAFLTVVVRGWRDGNPIEATLLVAWLSLLVFAAVGFIVGQIGGWIVEDSVRADVAAELAAQEARPVVKRPAGDS